MKVLMLRRSITLPEPQVQRVHYWAVRHHRSFAAEVRELIRRSLRALEKQQKRWEAYRKVSED